MIQFISRTGCTLATATLIGAFLSAVPLHGGQAQQTAAAPSAAQPAPHMATSDKHSPDRVEQRIKDLHAKLHITAAQEPLWSTFAQTMRDNAQAMRASVVDRSTRLRTMNAVDDLKSYQVVADQHSDGLKRLIPTFEALYASMSPDQQKNADHIFGERQHQHHART
jgi:protein CpxP